MDVVSVINRPQPAEMMARQATRPLDRALFLLLVVSPLGVTRNRYVRFWRWVRTHFVVQLSNPRSRARCRKSAPSRSEGSSDQQAELRSTRPVSQPPARRPSLKHVACVQRVGSTARVAEEVDQCL
jgi:hypothetical protein